MKPQFPFSLELIFIVAIITVTWQPARAQLPKHLEGYDISPLQKGEFLLLSKKPAEALKVFKDLWRREPGNSYAVRGIVRAFQALEKLPDAISYLNENLERRPENSPAVYGLGFVLYLQGQFESARSKLEESLRRDPENALALNTLGAVFIELKQEEAAVQKVKQAIDLLPYELMFYRNLQRIYIRSGKPDKFGDEYRSYLQQGPLEKAKGYGLVLAQELRQKSFKLYVDGNSDGTIDAIHKMVNIYREIDHKPGIVAGLFSLGVLFEEQGKLNQALEKYREVLKINSQHIQAREKIRNLEKKKE